HPARTALWMFLLSLYPLLRFSSWYSPNATGCYLSVQFRTPALTARTGYRLGDPLPQQQPDRLRPNPQATLESMPLEPFQRRTIPGLSVHPGLASVSRSCPSPEGRLATCY